ncbi:MAG: ribulose-phosphate 3-epimerase [Fimbriimonadaceae bacterium]
MSSPLVSASILSWHAGRLEEAVIAMEQAGADMIHFDIMDGQFVPPITFGAEVVRLVRTLTDLPFEAHLMTLTPEKHAAEFIDAGCMRVIFHSEATHHAAWLAGMIRDHGAEAGLAINPATPAECVLAAAPVLDMALVMTVNPGWGGQSFLPWTLEKVRRIRESVPRLIVEVDGGMNAETAREAVASGASILVSGSYVSRATDRRAAMASLKGSSCGVP